LRIVVDVNRLALLYKTESRVVKGKIASLEISTEVAAELDVLEVVNTSGKSRYNTNSTRYNAEQLRYR